VNGEVDSSARALITLDVWRDERAEAQALTVWVDTAFTGELVISRGAIQQFGLKQSSAVVAELADGKQVLLDTYSCRIDWFGIQRVVEVIESDEGMPLLGVGLLVNRKITIDYQKYTVELV
jgi:clan AA aspartic protease